MCVWMGVMVSVSASIYMGVYLLERGRMFLKEGKEGVIVVSWDLCVRWGDVACVEGNVT